MVCEFYFLPASKIKEQNPSENGTVVGKCENLVVVIFFPKCVSQPWNKKS